MLVGRPSASNVGRPNAAASWRSWSDSIGKGRWRRSTVSLVVVVLAGQAVDGGGTGGLEVGVIVAERAPSAARLTALPSVLVSRHRWQGVSGR